MVLIFNSKEFKLVLYKDYFATSPESHFYRIALLQSLNLHKKTFKKTKQQVKFNI